MHLRFVLAILFVLGTISGCGKNITDIVSGNNSTSTAPAGKPYILDAGAWSGTGIQLFVGTDSGTFELDCAHGSYSGQVYVDGSGEFTVNGVETPEAGAQIVDPLPPATFNVSLSGAITGDTMSLTISHIQGGTLLSSSYTLTKGTSGILMKCL